MVSKWWQNFILGCTVFLRDDRILLTLCIVFSYLLYLGQVQQDHNRYELLIIIYSCAVSTEKDIRIRRCVRHPLVFCYVSGPKAEADDIEWKEFKPAVCDLQMNGLISAAQPCLLPVAFLLSPTYWKQILHFEKMHHITASSSSFLHRQ